MGDGQIQQALVLGQPPLDGREGRLDQFAQVGETILKRL
jgi:hypothetical protein